MAPRTLSLPSLGAIVMVLLQVPACGLNTSGALESAVDDDASVEVGGQSAGGAAGKGGTSGGGTAGQAGKGGSAGKSGQAGASGTGNNAGSTGEGGAAGAAETGGAGGAGEGGATGEGGAPQGGSAGATGEGGAVQDSGPDAIDAPDDVLEAGGDTGPVCGLQDTSHPSCNSCMLEKCLSQCQECAANSECAVLVTCIAACNGDSGCQKECWNDHPSGQSSAGKLGGENGCLRDNCDSECSWLPDVSGGGCSIVPVERQDSRGWMVGALAALGLAVAVGRRRSGRITG